MKRPGWLSRWRQNKALLRAAVDAEGRCWEAKSYDELSAIGDDAAKEKTVEGHRLFFQVDLVDVAENGDLSLCVNVGGLPTFLGIKPCYHFFKRPDGSVYY